MGELALWVALLMAAWGAIVSFAGGRTGRADLSASAVRAVYAAFACVALGTSGLMVALVSSDLSFRLVASLTSANLPVAYKVAALWSGPAGSLLFCTLVLSTGAAIAVAASQARNATLSPDIVGTFSAMILFLVATLCFAANPYERAVPTPIEGQGMHPLRQHPGFILHPPMLYVGSFVASVPFAFAVAALAERQVDNSWMIAVRKWSIVSWFFLTIGLLAGMWWAYVEVGDAGPWALDPIRNLSIAPWLTTGAFVYSISNKEGPSVVRGGSILLAASSFLLAVFGMFIIRGGIMAMNPAVSWSPVTGGLTAFLALATLVVAYLLVTRRVRPGTPTGLHASVPEKRRRYGGHALQLGLVILVTAFAGNLFRREIDVALGSGETATVTDPFGDRRQFTSQGVSRFDVLNRHVVAVALRSAHDGEPTGLITSEEREYFDTRGVHTFTPSTKAGVDYSLKQDTYIVLTGVTGDRARLRIAFNPLVIWVWIGGAMIAVGGAVATWPSSIDGRLGPFAPDTHSKPAEATA